MFQQVWGFTHSFAEEQPTGFCCNWLPYSHLIVLFSGRCGSPKFYSPTTKFYFPCSFKLQVVWSLAPQLFLFLWCSWKGYKMAVKYYMGYLYILSLWKKGFLTFHQMGSTSSLLISDGHLWGFLGGSDSKESACNSGVAGYMGLTPRLGRSPGGGHGNPLQYSCLENPMNRGAWQAIVHRVTKSWAWLKWLSTHAQAFFRTCYDGDGQFSLFSIDLHTDFSGGRSRGLVFPSLEEFPTVCSEPHNQRLWCSQ